MVLFILCGVTVNGFAKTDYDAKAITPSVTQMPNAACEAIPKSDVNESFDPFNPNLPEYESEGFAGIEVGRIPLLQAGAKYCVDVKSIFFEKNGNIMTDGKKGVKKLMNMGFIIFKSHNHKIATVSNRGCVTALKNGETKIDIMYSGAKDFDINNPGEYKTTVDVKVVKNKIALSKKRLILKAAKSKRVKINNYPKKMVNKIKGSFSKEGIAKIDKVLYPGKKRKAALLIKGLKKGKAVLKVTALGTRLRCKVIVK